jgi:phosphoglycolate phosphatase
MKNRYKMVLFDLDGTLIDTLEDLADAVNHALELRGYPLHGLDEYRRMVGHGVRNLVKQALPEPQRGDESLLDAALADFKDWYTAHIDCHTRPYPGMPELVRDLDAAGVRMAVASNKFQAGTELLIKEFFPGIPFAAILGNREGHPLKPDPEIVGQALRAAGADRSEAVLVGDSGTDMQTARNGGIDAIAVGWGYRPMAPSADYRFAASVPQLRRMLME